MRAQEETPARTIRSQNHRSPLDKQRRRYSIEGKRQANGSRISSPADERGVRPVLFALVLRDKTPLSPSSMLDSLRSHVLSCLRRLIDRNSPRGGNV